MRQGWLGDGIPPRIPRDASSRLSLRTRHFSFSSMSESSAFEMMSTQTASERSAEAEDRIGESRCELADELARWPQGLESLPATAC